MNGVLFIDFYAAVLISLPSGTLAFASFQGTAAATEPSHLPSTARRCVSLMAFIRVQAVLQMPLLCLQALVYLGSGFWHSRSAGACCTCHGERASISCGAIRSCSQLRSRTGCCRWDVDV